MVDLATRKRLRQEWFEANGPCVRCGSDIDLEVDHIDPKLKVDHRVWSWSAVRREAELAKCQVLCHPCHVDKTWEGKRAEHGTSSCYDGGCRRDECRAAATARRQKYPSNPILGPLRGRWYGTIATPTEVRYWPKYARAPRSVCVHCGLCVRSTSRREQGWVHEDESNRGRRCTRDRVTP